jgi:PPOX class probable F420-dependent enzyme
METDWKQDFILNHRVARLATVTTETRPHIVPIVYAYDGELLYTPIDEKPKRVGAISLQRVRDVQANPYVALVIDHYTEDWTQLAWVQVRGQAEIVTSGARRAAGIALLHEKYPQYQTMPLDEHPVIIIRPRRILGWRATVK